MLKVGDKVRCVNPLKRIINTLILGNIYTIVKPIYGTKIYLHGSMFDTSTGFIVESTDSFSINEVELYNKYINQPESLKERYAKI